MPAGFDLLRRYFRVFRKYAGRRLFVIIVLLTLVMSYAEGIGIALFFPLFNQNSVAGGDSLSVSLGSVFRFLHIPLTPLGALPFIVVLFLVKAVLQWATITTQLFSATGAARRIRSRVVEALRRADYREISRRDSGQLTNLLSSEVPRAAAGLLYYVRAWPPGINIVVFLGIMLWLDWRLTLACIGLGAVMMLILRVTGRIARRYSEWTVTENSALVHRLIQALHAFKYLRATGSFDPFQKKIDRSADRLAHADYRSGAVAAFIQSVSQPLMLLFVVGVMYHHVAVRHEALATLFVALIYFFRISNELFTLQTHWQTFSSLIGSIDTVEATLDDLEHHREPRGTRAFGGLHHALSCEQVQFAYGVERQILKDISLKIPKRSTVAFVGESGGGKSTLVDLLTGTLRPTAGRVLIDDDDLAEVDIEAVRRRIGYVPQDSTVFDDTIANNITLWSEAEPERIRSAAQNAKCLEFIEAMPLGFDSEIGDRGVKLSGGQRQRLAIARELFKDPEILVLDEATSSLDSESERAIQQSIDALKGRMTILIIAHRLSTIRNCDYVYVLHEGRIVEDGRYEDLLARPGSRFRRMCDLQSLAEGVA